MSIYSNKLLVFLVFSLLMSCVDNKEKKQDNNNQLKEKLELEITLELKTSVEDEFKISVNNIEVDEFQKKNINVVETIPPSTEFEKITSNFGEENISNFVLINLGKLPKSVQINYISFSYGEKTITVNANNFDNNIGYNKFVEIDKTNFTIKTSRIDNKHNPVLYARRTLINKLLDKGNNKTN